MKKIILSSVLVLCIFVVYTQVPEYRLDISKTASTSFVRTYLWEIDCSVTPSIWDLFYGDQGVSQYTTILQNTGYTDSDWSVDGTITISNNTQLEATITGISDVISPAIAATLDCRVSFPYTLVPGETLNCTYSAVLPDGSSRINTVMVTTLGEVNGGTATVDVIFNGPTTEVNASVQVVDDSGTPGDLTDDRSWDFEGNATSIYASAFDCSDDEGTHTNTVTIVETGQTDDATVTVNCYPLDINKDASISFDREWSWTIDKSADQTDLILAQGQQFMVNYVVDVDATFIDENWMAMGNIIISNNTPLEATLTGISDVISPGDIAATLDCGVSFPYTLMPGETLNCTYSADLPDGTNRINSAVVTLQNYSYSSKGEATANGTTDFMATANVDFNTASNAEYDECVDVNDTYVGYLGTVCKNDVLFNYSRQIGPYESAGDYIIENTASFITNDRDVTGSDSYSIHVNVPYNGCTLTPGYWKTHNSSFKGGASMNADDAWESIGPLAELEDFFQSDQTYFEVLWTTSNGNAYYILAQAYIATLLNLLNGADYTAEVANAVGEATILFEMNCPDEISGLKGKAANDLRKHFISLAELLDNYNNGLIGSGHCSEEVEIGELATTKSSKVSNPLESKVELMNLQVYPNPFSEEVRFEFVSPFNTQAEINIYDITGRKIQTIFEGFVKENTLYKTEFKPKDEVSGIYFYKLNLDDEIYNGKLIYKK